jgi:cellobiose phosphorylase
LLSFTSYDSSTREYYLALGGYGWAGFSVREVSETSMVLAECDPVMTLGALRFVASTQLANGDVPKWHNLRRDRSSHECDSDNELWFVLGCMESVRLSGRAEWLDERCPFWDEGDGTLWEHCRRAFFWVRDAIGRGAHGLILIRDGDWNDYLSLMGAKGRGESVMNSGMACRAFSAMAVIARRRGETELAAELEHFTAELRAAVAAAFDEVWFLRGYTDAGKPVGGSAENRLFINAQTWSVLGGCGTRTQQMQALQAMIRECHSNIGLLLMSRPYSSPAPDDISWCAIPSGEGENAGIWPQTVHWAVWALAETGMLDEARAEWECGTLHAHARHFPDVPYGVFNGPDCFSSRWAGAREGWTQQQLIDRARFAPMSPIVAWQGFSWRRLMEAARRSPTGAF